MRFLVMAVTLLALLLGGSSGALAQKTKSKPQAEQTQQNSLDPNDPDDLEEIIAEADEAYFADNGGEPDYAYAFEMYSLAANAGDAYSMNRLALMYDRGEHVEQDFYEAFDWYMKAAEAGLPAAMSNVASMYRLGEGVGQDYEQAMDWFRKAADNDYSYALYAIGELYLGGHGVAKDPTEAAAWYQRASDAGEPNGHWALALRYLYGDGVAMDTRKAGDLAYLALVNGLDIALDEFKEIGSADTSPNFRRRIQELLKRDGFYKGAIDGSFGPQTMRAVEAAFGSEL